MAGKSEKGCRKSFPRRVAVLGASAFSLLLMVSLLSPPLFAEDRSIPLRFDPPAGKVLNYKSSSSIQLTVQGMEMFVNTSMDLEMSFPDTTSEEGRVVDVKVTKVSGSIMRGEMTMDYESPLKLEGKTVTLVVSPKGEVVKVVPHGYIQGMRSLDDLKEVFKFFFPSLPDSTIKVGSEWSEKIVEKDEDGLGATVLLNYKLKKLEDYKGLEVAALEGKINIKGKIKAQDGVVDGESKGKVKAKIATEGCYIAECKYRMDIKGKLVGDSPGDGGSEEYLVSLYFRCKLRKGKK